MNAVTSGDLRNHTAEVLRRVGAGEVVSVTVHGAVVAEIHPPSDRRPLSWTREEFLRRVVPARADAALREFLRKTEQSPKISLIPGRDRRRARHQRADRG